VNRKTILIIVAVVLVLCICCVGIVIVVGLMGGLTALGLTQPAADAGEAFMTALKDNDFDKAYNLCTPALQRELQNARALETRVKNGKVQPTQWSFSSRNISGDQAQLDGSVTFVGNKEGTVRLTLTQVGGEWKVVGFNLREK
jgi:hypothetical protein